MEAFTKLYAAAAPIDWPNVDTDQIAPARFLRRPRSDGYADVLFHDLRYDCRGKARQDFILNRPAFREAKILVADRNFGAGSSREQAVWALMDYVVRCVIGVSFGDIFFANAANQGLLLIREDAETVNRLRSMLHDAPGAVMEVDLEACAYRRPDAGVVAFDIEPTRRRKLLAGIDNIAMTLQFVEEIREFEARYLVRKHWIPGAGNLGCASTSDPSSRKL